MTDDDAPVSVRTGFFPFVSATDVEMEQAASIAVIAGSSASVAHGAAQVVIAGGDATVEHGGANLVISGGHVNIEHGGALTAIGGNVKATNGIVGLVLGRAELNESRLVFTPAGALALGVGLGATRTTFDDDAPLAALRRAIMSAGAGSTTEPATPLCDEGGSHSS